MKSKIDILFKMLEQLFSGKYDPFQFSFDLSNFCYDNYDKIENECKGLAYYLDQKIPYICDEAEPCFDPTHMIDELKKVYIKAKEMVAGNS